MFVFVLIYIEFKLKALEEDLENVRSIDLSKPKVFERWYTKLFFQGMVLLSRALSMKGLCCKTALVV